MSPLFHLSKEKSDSVSDGGSRKLATKQQFAALDGMACYKLLLHPKGVREPHWHPNADELGYCLKGHLLVSFYGNQNHKESFSIKEGEMFFIPSGALHAIENIGLEEAEVLLQFSSDTPEDFGLSSTFGMFSDEVLGNTWDMPASFFASIERSTDPIFSAKVEHSGKAHAVESPYRFSLEKHLPFLKNSGGMVRVARQDVWPVLKRQSMYSVHIGTKGMREPHWHPETAEMGYIHSGNGRMSIMTPSGKVDTYEIREGDLYFIPKAYPHHIENLGKEDLHLLIFFDQPIPGDVGFTGSVKFFSNDVLAATLKTERERIAALPIYPEDLLIVKKINVST